MFNKIGNNINMIKRHLAERLTHEAAKNPVVTLIGPRQSGKTTLIKDTFSDYAYVSLERPDRRVLLKEDPLGFLTGLGPKVILDEVQRTPDLLSYIQVIVDENDRPGQFIITGSQNLLLMQNISQTLAGRTAVLHLLPFSLTELQNKSPLEIKSLLDLIPSTAPLTSLWETIWKGFYPRIHDKSLDPTRWLADYHRTYVDRDVRDVLKVMDLDTFERFVRLTAARTGTELNLSSLAEDVGVSQPTAKEWLTALRIASLVTLLQPHHANYRKRVRKRPKLHFLDTGLVCYLLGIESAKTLASHPLRGAIFESFIVAELHKAFVHDGLQPRLFHWRDATGHEIDVVIDLGDRLLPVEIKSSTTIASDTFKGLRWWTGLSDNSNKNGILVYGGSESHKVENISVLPWHLA